MPSDTLRISQLDTMVETLERQLVLLQKKQGHPSRITGIEKKNYNINISSFDKLGFKLFYIEMDHRKSWHEALKHVII